MRLATFNILHGRSPADGRVDVARFADAIRSLDADVLGLQEVDRDQPRSQLADLTAVAAEAMGAVTHRFVAALSGTPGATWIAATGDEQPGTASYGIALLSRYEVSTWQTVRLPAVRFRFPMYLPGPRKVMMISEEPRAAVIGTVETPFGRLAVANTHLSFVPGLNRRQLHTLMRDLAPFPGPIVLMGDLNVAGRTPERITGYRPLVTAPTFPAEAPSRQLDHILLRGAVAAVRGARSRHLPMSDHRALCVDLDGWHVTGRGWRRGESDP